MQCQIYLQSKRCFKYLTHFFKLSLQVLCETKQNQLFVNPLALAGRLRNKQIIKSYFWIAVQGSCSWVKPERFLQQCLKISNRGKSGCIQIQVKIAALEIWVHDDLDHSLSSGYGKGTFRSTQCCTESNTRNQENLKGKPVGSVFCLFCM